jgi:hypothetical protein
VPPVRNPPPPLGGRMSRGKTLVPVRPQNFAGGPSLKLAGKRRR